MAGGKWRRRLWRDEQMSPLTIRRTVNHQCQPWKNKRMDDVQCGQEVPAVSRGAI